MPGYFVLFFAGGSLWGISFLLSPVLTESRDIRKTTTGGRKSLQRYMSLQSLQSKVNHWSCHISIDSLPISGLYVPSIFGSIRPPLPNSGPTVGRPAEMSSVVVFFSLPMLVASALKGEFLVFWGNMNWQAAKRNDSSIKDVNSETTHCSIFTLPGMQTAAAARLIP